MSSSHLSACPSKKHEGHVDEVQQWSRTSLRSRHHRCRYLPGLLMHPSQPSSHRCKSEFCTKQSPWSFTTWYLTSWKSAPSVSPYQTCPVTFRSLSALEQLQGPHHQWHIRCLSGVWSGTTLCRASVQLSKQPDATHSARFVGWSGLGRRLPRPG